MLRELHIENVAVIERADLELGPGLNILTGETGAGKSILVDAMHAILGARASRELVRTRGHFVVDVITDRVAGTNFGHCCRLAVTVIELVTYALICWYGIVWVLRAQATFQSIPWLQVRWAYAAIPVSAFFMTIYGVRDLILAVRAFLPAKSA